MIFLSMVISYSRALVGSVKLNDVFVFDLDAVLADEDGIVIVTVGRLHVADDHCLMGILGKHLRRALGQKETRGLWWLSSWPLGICVVILPRLVPPRPLPICAP